MSDSSSSAQSLPPRLSPSNAVKQAVTKLVSAVLSSSDQSQQQSSIPLATTLSPASLISSSSSSSKATAATTVTRRVRSLVAQPSPTFSPPSTVSALLQQQQERGGTNLNHLGNTKHSSSSSSSLLHHQQQHLFDWSLLSLVSHAADVVMVFGTAPGWIVQLRSVLHRGTAQGFSWQTALLLLCCYTLRVGYYFGEQYHMALLLQCFVMITVVLSLIAAIIDAPDSSTPLTKYQFQHATTKNTSVVSESTQVSEDDISFETYQHSLEEEASFAKMHPILANSWRLFDKMFKRRWAGGSFYFGFVVWDGPNTKFVYSVYLVILCAVCYFCSIRLPHSKFLTSAVGYVALGVEASVVFPQVILTETQRSVEGLSKFLVGTWFAGDLMKVLYFVGKEQPLPFVVCGVIQFATDLFIIGQFARFGKNSSSNNNSATGSSSPTSSGGGGVSLSSFAATAPVHHLRTPPPFVEGTSSSLPMQQMRQSNTSSGGNSKRKV